MAALPAQVESATRWAEEAICENVRGKPIRASLEPRRALLSGWWRMQHTRAGCRMPPKYRSRTIRTFQVKGPVIAYIAVLDGESVFYTEMSPL
jgi:hypothetical protein